MPRLIDADKFIEKLESSEYESSFERIVKATMIKMLKDQPTACNAADAQDINIGMWHDAEEPPEDDRYILVSFSNFSFPAIAYYRHDEDGGGAYYYETEEESLSAIGLFVNGWMELPKCRKDDEDE